MQPEDWAWMRRRVEASGIGFAVLLSLCAILQLGAQKPGEKTPSSVKAANDFTPNPPSIEALSPPGKNLAPGVRSVPPSNWRRTSRGWEHIGTWPAAESAALKPSLAELVRDQEASEPEWMKRSFRTLQMVPPLAFAVLQVIAIGFICQLGRRRAS